MDTGFWSGSVPLLEIVLAVLNVVVYGYCVWLWVQPEAPAARACEVCGSTSDPFCVGRQTTFAVGLSPRGAKAAVG